MDILEALRILGLPYHGTPSTEQVSTAYRAKAKQCHPDAGGSNGDMARLNQARDTLLKWLDKPLSRFNPFGDLRKTWEEIMREQTAAQGNEDDWGSGFRSRHNPLSKEFEADFDAAEQKRAEQKKYTKGVKTAHASDVERFRSALLRYLEKHRHNPACLQAMDELSKDYKYYHTDNYRVYYLLRNKRDEILKTLLTDTASYQERNRGDKTYYYRVSVVNGKTLYDYAGKSLPESALGELTATKRKAKCVNEANRQTIEWHRESNVHWKEESRWSKEREKIKKYLT